MAKCIHFIKHFSIFKPSRSDLLSPLWWFGHLGEDLGWLPYSLVVVWSLSWWLVGVALLFCGGLFTEVVHLSAYSAFS